MPMLEAMGRAGTPFARSALGVVVRQGAALPDIGTPDALCATLLDARSLAYSDPTPAPSGIHLQRVFQTLGIADALRLKTTLRTPFDGGVGLIADGDVELGIFLVSEIVVVHGVTLVGLLPSGLQSYVVYAGAVSAGSTVSGPALAFLEFIADPARRGQWEAAGFESITSSAVSTGSTRP